MATAWIVFVVLLVAELVYAAPGTTLSLVLQTALPIGFSAVFTVVLYAPRRHHLGTGPAREQVT